MSFDPIPLQAQAPITSLPENYGKTPDLCGRRARSRLQSDGQGPGLQVSGLARFPGNTSPAPPHPLPPDLGPNGRGEGSARELWKFPEPQTFSILADHRQSCRDISSDVLPAWSKHAGLPIIMRSKSVLRPGTSRGASASAPWASWPKWYSSDATCWFMRSWIPMRGHHAEIGSVHKFPGLWPEARVVLYAGSSIQPQ